jgi:hypothetical protein
VSHCLFHFLHHRPGVEGRSYCDQRSQGIETALLPESISKRSTRTPDPGPRTPDPGGDWRAAGSQRRAVQDRRAV